MEITNEYYTLRCQEKNIIFPERYASYADAYRIMVILYQNAVEDNREPVCYSIWKTVVKLNKSIIEYPV